jgi:hypothetical protein
MAPRAAGDHDEGSAAPENLRLLNLDPNTHAFVMATAALTSICFAISAMNVLAVILSHVLR